MVEGSVLFALCRLARVLRTCSVDRNLVHGGQRTCDFSHKIVHSE